MTKTKTDLAIKKLSGTLTTSLVDVTEASEQIYKFVQLWTEHDNALRELVRREVTEEMVLAFSEQSMLPYDEAKKFLQEVRYLSYQNEAEEENEDK